MTDNHTASSDHTAAVSSVVSSRISPIKSSTDERLYRIITLPNQLEVTLVSDPETDKAAASMDVGVGNFSDPIDLPGLAHFLEHMLFLGTERYPDENSYSNFLNSHAGNSNAFTSMENTNYYFDIQYDYLSEALDRFASFFLCPLFTPSATDRELNAVHNEHSKNINNDSWRISQIIKQSADPNHPLQKFSTGNIKTLKDIPAEKGINVRDALLKFYDEYYCANIMKLTIIGRESLDILEKWAYDKFHAIKNKNINRPSFSSKPYSALQLKNIYHVIPLKEIRSLQLFFPLPSVWSHYQEKPVSLLSHLMGHEGKGSILSLLKKKGWCNSLTAGIYYSLSCFSAFYLSMDLTAEGIKKENIYSIIAIIFQYITILKSLSSDKLKELWTECCIINSNSFRFKNKEQPYDYASSLASKMQQYPALSLLSGSWLYNNYNESLIKQFLEYFIVDNLRIQIIASKKEYSAVSDNNNKDDSNNNNKFITEPWYGTEYCSVPIDNELLSIIDNAIKQDNPSIFVPHPNPFIAEDFTIKAEKFIEEKKNYLKKIGEGEGKKIEGEEEKKDNNNNNNNQSLLWKEELPDHPIKLSLPSSLSSSGIDLYWKPDSIFIKPKANIMLKFISSAPASSPSNALLSGLWTKLLEDNLNEFSYDADIAGLHYSLTPNYSGLHLSVKGFNDKLSILLKAILNKMRDYEIKEERFYLIKETMQRSLKSWTKDQPYAHAIYDESMALEPGLWHHDEKIAVIDSLTPNDLRLFHQQLMHSLHIIILVHGNMTKNDAINIAQDTKNALSFTPLFPSQIPDLRVIQLLSSTTYLRERQGLNDTDENSSTITTFQIGPDTVENNAALSLLEQIASESCYNQLRTIEQLGYFAFSNAVWRRGVWYYRILLQSSNRHPSHLYRRTEAFIQWLRNDIITMTDDQWYHYINSVIVKKEEKDKRLSQETQRWWFEIIYNRFDWQRTPKEVAAVKSLTKELLLKFFDNYLLMNGNRSIIITKIYGNRFNVNSVTEEEKKINIDTPILSTDKDNNNNNNNSDDGKKEELSDNKITLMADAPPSTAPIIRINSFAEFRRSQSLFPCFI